MTFSHPQDRPHALGTHSFISHLYFSGAILLFSLSLISEVFARTIRLRDLFFLTLEQVVLLGVQSMGLVIAAASAIGAVMAIQFAAGLQRFGGQLYVPQLVAISILRELGPVLMGLLLAGRIASGITSELASMKVTEQVDALRALGSSPIASLALPRVFACILTFPILGLITYFISILSAMMMMYLEYSFDPIYYLSKTLALVEFPDIWTGLLKILIFGTYIGLVSSWRGLNTIGGTRAVGISTTWIVVNSSIFILVSDFFLSKIFILTVFKYE